MNRRGQALTFPLHRAFSNALRDMKREGKIVEIVRIVKQRQMREKAQRRMI